MKSLKEAYEELNEGKKTKKKQYQYTTKHGTTIEVPAGKDIEELELVIKDVGGKLEKYDPKLFKVFDALRD